MQTQLGQETLRTGETLHILRVEPPDPLQQQIRPFLAHKPPHYRAHIDAALSEQCDLLETRFYLALIHDRIVGNIMTTEQQGVGILGHVHTHPEHRRKGICSTLMHYQMNDFRRRSGRILLLGTGYQSPAYHIYQRFGFRDWKTGRPGLMRYDAPEDPDFETRFFAPAPGTVEPAQWRHWPLVALLAAVPCHLPLRSITLNLWGTDLLEGPYCEFMHCYATAPNASARVLVSATGAVVAMATCVPDTRWHGPVHRLDLFYHPQWGTEALLPLLQALPLPERTQCYADPHDAVKIHALQQTGWHLEAVLPRQYCIEGRWHAVHVFGKERVTPPAGTSL
ncbi:MAG: GNAT family N-acetyltransferase [Chloroherpetonaceae bacterium]|nr:GNAT family N-acetyltransferase [Chthonomonadaceae bacterium]MDW8207307.1 GNAT family N-acetyltransferase [Chloroherpetonaceae bacterium]